MSTSKILIYFLSTDKGMTGKVLLILILHVGKGITICMIVDRNCR